MYDSQVDADMPVVLNVLRAKGHRLVFTHYVSGHSTLPVKRAYRALLKLEKQGLVMRGPSPYKRHPYWTLAR